MLPRLLLIFVLLFTQMGGLMHGISHALVNQSTNFEQGQNSDSALPHLKHCDLCMAYAHIGNALGSNSIHFASSENSETLHFSASICCISNTFTAYTARAPPYSI